MEKRSYQKLISCWWLSLETEADNIRVNPSLFSKPSSEKSSSKKPEPHSAALKPSKSLAVVNKEETSKHYDQNGHTPGLNFFNDVKPSNNTSKSVENCNIIKEAIQKLKQFLATSHKKGCTDPNCVYNEHIHTVKVAFKMQSMLTNGMVKIPKKRGRKSRLELQQEELAQETSTSNS